MGTFYEEGRIFKQLLNTAILFVLTLCVKWSLQNQIYSMAIAKLNQYFGHKLFLLYILSSSMLLCLTYVDNFYDVLRQKNMYITITVIE